MRFELPEPFKADYRRLSGEEREMFRLAAEAFNGASDRWVEAKGPASWPGDLPVQSGRKRAPGIFEMTRGALPQGRTAGRPGSGQRLWTATGAHDPRCAGDGSATRACSVSPKPR